MDKIILSLEHEIAALVNKDSNCTVHFNYIDAEIFSDEKFKGVEAVTMNSETKEIFLLQKVPSKSKTEGLNKILEYVKNHKNDNSFTFVWRKKTDSENRHTSYFYCQNVMEAILKFFFNKNTEDYIIYEIKMNPVS